MIEETHVSFEVARLLKEKGFDGKCNRVYQGTKLKYTTLDISPLMCLGELGGFDPKDLYITNSELGDIVYTAPTHQMAMKWLREVHNLFIFPFPQRNTDSFWVEIYSIDKDKNEEDKWKNLYCETIDLKNYSTYEEAIEAALKYTLKNLI